jgi:hypothetical protein
LRSFLIAHASLRILLPSALVSGWSVCGSSLVVPFFLSPPLVPPSAPSGHREGRTRAAARERGSSGSLDEAARWETSDRTRKCRGSLLSCLLSAFVLGERLPAADRALFCCPIATDSTRCAELLPHISARPPGVSSRPDAMVSMRSRRSSVDHSIRPTQAAAAVGGLKTIGLLGGVALLINNITGSAMVLFPSLYQAAGWFTVTMTLLLIAFLSYLCSVMIIEAMAAMPGNHTFTKRVEYTGLAYYYLGQRGYYFTQFFFQFSLAFNNMSSIIQSVQVMDFALVAIFGKDCAIPEFYPNFSFHCPEPVKHDITPFGDIYLLSIGFIITALVCAPLGFWNLDDNIIIQKVSCSAVVLMVLTWCGIFIAKGDLDGSRVPAVGDQFTNVLGTCVFNFASQSQLHTCRCEFALLLGSDHLFRASRAQSSHPFRVGSTRRRKASRSRRR